MKKLVIVLLVMGISCSPTNLPESTVTVIAKEMSFAPAEIHVDSSKTVKLILQNNGGAVHDLIVRNLDPIGAPDLHEHNHHQTHSANAEIGDQIHLAAAPGEMASTVVQLKAGRFEYYCSVPGHRQAGMRGLIVVH
ncbi:MAG: cupredoxin domain-containing protein [Leptospirales bacterium]|nr:cupredoxin domain-containing protein [Leptospirales bacterium]